MIRGIRGGREEGGGHGKTTRIFKSIILARIRAA